VARALGDLAYAVIGAIRNVHVVRGIKGYRDRRIELRRGRRGVVPRESRGVVSDSRRNCIRGCLSLADGGKKANSCEGPLTLDFHRMTPVRDLWAFRWREGSNRLHTLWG